MEDCRQPKVLLFGELSPRQRVRSTKNYLRKTFTSCGINYARWTTQLKYGDSQPGLFLSF